MTECCSAMGVTVLSADSLAHAWGIPKSTLFCQCITPDWCWLLQWLLVVSGFPRSFKLELAQLGKNLCHCIIRVRDWLEWYYNVIGLLNSSWFVNRTVQLLSPLYLLQLRTYPVLTRLTRLSPLKTLLDNYLSYHPKCLANNTPWMAETGKSQFGAAVDAVDILSFALAFYYSLNPKPLITQWQ